MNRVHIIIYMLLACAVSVHAQDGGLGKLSRGPVRFVPGSALLQTNPSTGMAFQSVGSPFIGADGYSSRESDVKPSGNNRAIRKSDAYVERDDSTNFTKGEFHASVDLSVMAGFGKGAPKGAGFAQNITATYTAPLGKRAWLTAGGYMSHLNWDGINTTNAGLYGELGYNFNDHWSAYIYGQKSLANSGMGDYYPYYGYYGYTGYSYGAYGYPGYNPYADRLGAAIRWKPNDHFWLELSVEKDWMPKHDYFYDHRPWLENGHRW